jgi:dTDP-4-dehydrorhamnose reductase
VKAWISGGHGFVGSHLVRAFDDVCAPTHAEVDVTDADAVRRSIAAFAPDAVIHAAILNDFTRLEREGWREYVGATRNVVAAADGAQVVLVSTDWVFNGPANESTPPNPINLYGMLKAASELVVGGDGAVARISAVQAVSDAPRSQDHGFGYFVAALVRALRAGERFTVWEGADINMVATPALADDAAQLIARIVAGGHTGIFHCCGGESVDRRTLALRTVEAFGLDGDLLDFGPPPAPAFPVPYDTSLDAKATAAALGVELPSLDDQLRRLFDTQPQEVRA